MTVATVIQDVFLLGALGFLIPAVVAAVTAIFKGGFDDVDTRGGPRRQFPK